MERNKAIKCDVQNCKYIDNKCRYCVLDNIHVSHNNMLTSYCESYKEK